jgi:hypothetical protein
MKEQIDILRNTRVAQDELHEKVFCLKEKLGNIEDFLQNVVECIVDDTSHLYPIKALRADLQELNEGVLILLNNLDITTAIPTDTTGCKIDV